MKSFKEWREEVEVENVPGWEKMPKSQKELIHYHRLSEKYRSESYQYSDLIEKILGDLEGSLLCSGVATKYRRILDNLKIKFAKNQVPIHF